jgi:hypothetical protein
MKDRYIKILLTVIAINLTVITLNSMASIQKVVICDQHDITACAALREFGMGNYHLVVGD